MINRPVFNPLSGSVSRAFSQFGNGWLPRSGLLAWCANRFDPEQLAFIDKIGGSIRTLHDLQYIQADGTGYFVNAALVTAGITVTQVTGSGTTTYSSPSAGRINMTAGTAWDFTVEWSDGKVSEYAFCSIVTATYAVCFDRSGNGRHLVATGFADLSLVCLSGREYGSDVLNLYGYSDGGLGPELATDPELNDPDNWTFTNESEWTTSGGEFSISNAAARNDAHYGTSNYFSLPVGSTAYSVVEYENVSGTFRMYTPNIHNLPTGNGIISYEDVIVIGTVYHIISPQTGASGTIKYFSTKQLYPSTTPIPASTTPGIDAIGNALTHPGRAKYNLMPKNAPCVAFDGTGSLAVKKDGVAYTITGSTISNGGTAELAISTSSITCAAGGTCWNLVITEADENVITFPLSESSGTTVFGYDTSGNTYTGTCTGFLDTGAIWSTQSEYFHGLTYSYRDSSGVLIPANPYTGLACDGNALTSQPLKWNNSADYTMPDADQIREALGWTYGIASDEYDADGTPLEKTLTELETLGVGPRFYFGTKGLAVYNVDQTTTDAKIKSVLGV